MRENDHTPLVIGWGELGKPIYNLIRSKYPTADWLDIDPKPIDIDPDIVHIAFQCNNRDEFINTVLNYISKFKPKLLLIDSTVSVGTTMLIHNLTNRRFKIAHSPIRGNIRDGMDKGLRGYTKYIGPVDHESGVLAQEYYKSLDLQTFLAPNPQTTELAKLWETSVYGIMIAYTQEIAREAKAVDADYDSVVSFIRSTQEESRRVLDNGKYYPRPVMDMDTPTKGVIKGHCLCENIKLLQRTFSSQIIDSVLTSNELRKQEVNSISDTRV